MFLYGNCVLCNYEAPGPDNICSLCSALNLLVNQDSIPRNGGIINFMLTAISMQTYFGCQVEFSLLLFTNAQGMADRYGIDLDIKDFNLDEVASIDKQTSWINDDVTKQFNPSKFEQLAKRADANEHIMNWDLLDHQ